MKVKKNSIKIRTTLPPESQNSASPKAPTARILMKLCSVSSGLRTKLFATARDRDVRIYADDTNNDTGSRSRLGHGRTPVGKH